MKKGMKSFLWFLAAIGIAIIVGPMIIGPFLAKSKNWVAEHADVRPIEPEALEPVIKGYIDDAKSEFESLGFQFHGYMTLKDFAPDTTTYFGLFNNGQDNIIGMTVVITNTEGQAIGYHELTSKYADGYAINVSDSPMLGVYTNPDNKVYRYPDVYSIKSLNSRHGWLTSHDERAKNPVGLSTANAIAEINNALAGR